MSSPMPTRDFLDPDVLARLRGLPLFARKVMLGSVSGRHRSPHRGSSVEFAEYRKYVAGDDLRRLDWRAYGRTDRFFVKEFEADTNLRMVMVVDTSGSMGFGSTGLSKLDYAKRMAATLSYLAMEQGDAVGLACVAHRVLNQLPARRNPAHLSSLFDCLANARAEGETELIAVLHELAETVAPHALVILFSDLFVQPELLQPCFEHLRFRKHDVSVFHLLDPEEIAFDFERPTRFVDMENENTVFAEPSEIADAYQAAFREYLEQTRQLMLRAAVDYHRVGLDQSYEQVLSDFLVGRTQGRRGG
ncbi:hypothetical protein Pla52o_02450 [Novipirellula galeiformis]|uniref:DUF58 domain-containing protein n=1 Tax=Novipirellula galeiformis TaxID=2528004 RepID=A0A5C6CPK0_9BACT|nr:DUF58 domain-containing protein [Novipirellula galeiformis]TWU26392.1 hypothetical protein Pla52o_02450 [Novipirellula galeiformis]